jgi:hypothetical protein
MITLRCGSGWSRTAFVASLVLAISVWLTRCQRAEPLPRSIWGQKSYSTKFSFTENPISDNRKWINGETAGLDWANVQATPGMSFGTQTGEIRYNDSTALLTGTWGPNQGAEAEVQCGDDYDNIFREVELRLRSSLSPHRATGYEFLFRCSKSSKAYAAIVRWNGPLGNFTGLADATGSRYGVADGDVIKATVVGSTLTAYLNGVPILTATDSTFTDGSPGIGFCLWLNGNALKQDRPFGFRNFSSGNME